MLFSELVRETLSELTTEVKRQFLRRLEEEAREYVSTRVVDAAARALIKSVDELIKVTVKSLETEDDQARFIAAYVDEVTDQLDQLKDALTDYVPFAVAVEREKELWGGKSAQANAARKARKKWMLDLRGEVRDTFNAAAGKEVED